MKVTIDRAKWRTGRYGPAHTGGRGFGYSGLLNRFSNRCCLGFLGAACGLPDAIAAEKVEPCQVQSDAEWPERLFFETDARMTERSWEAIFITINDDTSVDDATREAWIAEGFRTILDVEVEFVGEYPPC